MRAPPLALAGLLALGCAGRAALPPPAWLDLLAPAALPNWESIPFGGEGAVEFLPGALRLDFGAPLTGVRWAAATLPDGQPPPRQDYEIELEAVRLAGSDFFCGLTFPVGDAHLTLVLGGWGGSLVGLSCLDGADASANETTRFLRFASGRPQRVRLRVAGGRVELELARDGGEPAERWSVPVAGRRLGLRPEVELCRPLGVASYQTRAEIRALRLRRLPPAKEES